MVLDLFMNTHYIRIYIFRTVYMSFFSIHWLKKDLWGNLKKWKENVSCSAHLKKCASISATLLHPAQLGWKQSLLELCAAGCRILLVHHYSRLWHWWCWCMSKYARPCCYSQAFHYVSAWIEHYKQAQKKSTQRSKSLRKKLYNH